MKQMTKKQPMLLYYINLMKSTAVISPGKCKIWTHNHKRQLALTGQSATSEKTTVLLQMNNKY